MGTYYLGNPERAPNTRGTGSGFICIYTVLQSKRAKLFNFYFIMPKPKHIVIGY